MVRSYSLLPTGYDFRVPLGLRKEFPVYISFNRSNVSSFLLVCLLFVNKILHEFFFRFARHWVHACHELYDKRVHD